MSPWTDRTIVLGLTPPSAAPGLPLLPGAQTVEAASASTRLPEPTPLGCGRPTFTADPEPTWRREQRLDIAQEGGWS